MLLFKQIVKQKPHRHAILLGLNCGFNSHIVEMNEDIYRAIEIDDLEALKRFLAVQGGVDATIAVPSKGRRLDFPRDAQDVPFVVSPLMLACKLGRKNAVKLLVSSGCKVNFTTSISGTARALYKRSFNHPDFWASPLILACAGRHKDIVHILLKFRASPDKTSIINHRLEAVSPLFVASSTGDFHVVDLLLQYGARTNVFCMGLAPIHAACRAGNPEVVAALIRNGSSVNCKDDNFGCTPLHEACKIGSTDTVRVLLASGANTDALSSTQNSNFSRVHRSLAPKLPINGTQSVSCGVSALSLAIAGAHWGVAQALIEHEASANVPDTYGRTPLHYLCGCSSRDEEGEIRTFHALLRGGADLERRDHNAFKGLHYAAALNKWKLIEVWLSLLGRPIPNRAGNKETCLHVACAFGSTESASSLIDSGKFIQAYNGDGHLPFHLACAGGHIFIVDMMLRRGLCPPDTPTLSGETGAMVSGVAAHAHSALS